MLQQRFELTATIGGFSQDQANALPTFHNEERDLHVQVALSEQFARAQAAFSDFASVVGDQTRKGFRRLILDEAFKNVLYHGFPYVEKRCDATALSLCRMTIETQVTDSRRAIVFVLTLDDHTPVFEKSLVPDATDDEYIDRPTGRGILVMESLGVTISQVPQSRGKTVIYTWREEEVSEDEASTKGESGSD